MATTRVGLVHAWAVSHPRLRSEVADLQSKSVVPTPESHQSTARRSQIAALKGRVSSSLAVCLGAQTDQLPASTFWTVSGDLVSGLLTQRRRSCGEAHDLTLRLRHAVSVGSVRCARRLSPCARPKVRYKSMRAHAASDLLACARQTCSVSRSDKLPVGPHLRTPVATSLPKGQAQRSIQIDGLRVPCVLLQSPGDQHGLVVRSWRRARAAPI